MKDNLLYDGNGQRLYLTADERDAFIIEAQRASREIRTLCSVLAYSGCRVSEALELIPSRIDFSDRTLIFRTLKKRREGVYRAVPVPPILLDTIDMVHGIKEILSRQKNDEINAPLWNWSRTKAWYSVKDVMDRANIQDGPHKTPKGLRHAFGIMAITKGVPLNLLSKWMGHGTLEVTAIYANAQGEEQHAIASLMWQ